jgi:hypothetical protein
MDGEPRRSLGRCLEKWEEMGLVARLKKGLEAFWSTRGSWIECLN